MAVVAAGGGGGRGGRWRRGLQVAVVTGRAAASSLPPTAERCTDEAGGSGEGPERGRGVEPARRVEGWSRGLLCFSGTVEEICCSPISRQRLALLS
nr:unnamed protein product [Digitaria exilis]